MLDGNNNSQNPVGSIEKKLIQGLAGKFLVFPLSKEKYGIEILKVQEIIGISTITRVPRSSPHIKGVINLRGKIIPVIDLRLKFKLETMPYDERTCVVVINLLRDGMNMAVGVIVDTVQEVMYFDNSQIEAAPDYGVRLDNHFIIGMGRKTGSELIVLVDIEKALFDIASSELKGITEA